MFNLIKILILKVKLAFYGPSKS